MRFVLESLEDDGLSLSFSVIAFNGAGLSSSSFVDVTLDTQLPVFAGKAILDCCTTDLCRGQDIDFAYNDRLVKACWKPGDFVQNISGVARFEARLQVLKDRRWVISAGPCDVSSNQTAAQFGLDSEEPCGRSAGRLQSGHKYRIAVRAISGSAMEPDCRQSRMYQMIFN